MSSNSPSIHGQDVHVTRDVVTEGFETIILGAWGGGGRKAGDLIAKNLG